MDHTILHFYEQRIAEYTSGMRGLRQKRNVVSILRVIFFICVFWWGYRYFSSNREWYFLTGALGSFAVFLALAVWDNKLIERIAILKASIQCCSTEIAYLKGDYSGLDRGDTFADGKHPYASDLDIFGEDSLFQHINRTSGTESARLLAEWLLHPCSSGDEIAERLEATRELSKKPDLLLSFRAQAMVSGINQPDRVMFDRWAKQPPFFKKRGYRWLVYFGNLFMLVCLLLAVFSIIPYSFVSTVFVVQLMCVLFCLKGINSYHERLGVFMKSFGRYLPLVELLYAQRFESKALRDIYGVLFSDSHHALHAFKGLNRLLSAFDQRGNIMVSILTNGFYTSDFHLILQLDDWNRKYGAFLDNWLRAIYKMDVLMCMANYRMNHLAFPEPLFDESAWFEAEGLGHPLLPEDNRVCNNFGVKGVHELYIVTGANMAGKSTFLRTVGINFVLALSGNVVCAHSCRFGIARIFTSMRTSDNLSKGSSYFHAEIQRLKGLVEDAERGGRLFIILDEILKGTNSQDKLNGSRLFLKRLLSLPVSGLIATHDLALGELHDSDPDHFFNICFEIENTPDGILYDYRLKPGVSRNMNASILLEQLGLI